MDFSKCKNHTSSLNIMRTFLGLLVLSLALAANGSSLSSRIVGGSDAPEGEYPYMVSLWYSTNRFFCGGSIINNRYILTAAHCIYRFTADRISVIVGSNVLSQPGQRFQAETLIPHENFSYPRANDDIGLIRLTEEIGYGDKVQPITLPSSDYEQEGTSVVFTGWGLLSAGGTAPDNLQQINLRTTNYTECRRRWIDVDYSKQVCTLTKSGEGVCNMDSGGPLVASGTQIGVLSHGKPCAVGWPDVFTRVQFYLDWINDHIQA